MRHWMSERLPYFWMMVVGTIIAVAALSILQSSLPPIDSELQAMLAVFMFAAFLGGLAIAMVGALILACYLIGDLVRLAQKHYRASRGGTPTIC